MPRDPPVTIAVRRSPISPSPLSGIRGPQYTGGARDPLSGSGREAGRAPVDPARHLAEHLAGADLEKGPEDVRHHRFEGGVPESRVDELGREQLPDLLRSPERAAVGSVERYVGVSDRAAGGDGRSHSLGDRAHELTGGGPGHSGGQKGKGE